MGFTQYFGFLLTWWGVLVLAALEPPSQDLQEGGAAADGGDGGDHAVGELAHARGARNLQAIAGAQRQVD